MKAKRGIGQAMGIEVRVVTIAFWLVGLMALFQMMPAAAYLRQGRSVKLQRGGRHVS